MIYLLTFYGSTNKGFIKVLAFKKCNKTSQRPDKKIIPVFWFSMNGIFNIKPTILFSCEPQNLMAQLLKIKSFRKIPKNFVVFTFSFWITPNHNKSVQLVSVRTLFFFCAFVHVGTFKQNQRENLKYKKIHEIFSI